MNPQKRYLCIGEKFRDDVSIGDCGETKTLMEWLRHLYPTTNPKILKDYFEGDPDDVVVKYIFDNRGKRLKKVK